jgi:hypothetical protein
VAVYKAFKISRLAQETKRLAVPNGVWPSLLVLSVSLALFFSVYLLGFWGIRILGSGSQFLPAHRVPWFAESVIKYHMDYAMNADEYNDVVFLGASGAQAGIIPHLFEETTGLRVYNFGTLIDIGPDGHLEIFRAYLRSHPKPKLLVYLAFPRDIGDTESIDQELRDRFIRAYGSELKTSEPEPSLGPQRYFQEGFWAIYGWVKGGLKHPYDAARGNRPSHRELGPMLAQERGFQEYPQGVVLNLDYLDEMDEFTISAWYDRSLTETAQLARDLNIGFMVWVMPVPTPKAPIEDQPIIAWAEQFQAAFPAVAVEGLPVQEYEHSLWGNGFHLNRAGAEVLTRQVGQKDLEFLNQDPGG